MKRKFLIFILAIVCVFALAFGLTACDLMGGGSSADNTGDGNTKHEHNYAESEITPTCTEQGYTLHTCTCGDNYKDNYVDALGHLFIIYDSDDNATCTEDGTQTAKCERCEETDTKPEEGSALNHSFINYKSDDNATCTEDGTKTAKCERCDQTDTITEAGTKLDHSFINYESDGNATCTEDGTQTAKCELCEETDTKPLEALGHIFIDYKPDGDAPCTEDGTQTAQCEYCDKTDTKFMAALGHNYVDGECTVCGYHMPTEGLNYQLNYDNETFYVAGIGSATESEIYIAEEYEGKPVTRIGERAFSGCSELTSITIGNSVTTIGERAFESCRGLTSVTIGNNITSIGEWAFFDCKEMTGLIITDSVISIGDGAFNQCISITSITIPDSVTTIGHNAFTDCWALADITIPDSVISIGQDVFSRTAYYNDATNWEDGVLYIGKHLIKAETSLTGTYEIEQGTLTIASGAFESCSGLTRITIPESVTIIGVMAFNACSGLTDINFAGTMEQWTDIKKGSNWDLNTGNYTIHCTDGDIAKS